MSDTAREQRHRLEALDAPGLVAHQLARLNLLLRRILPHNHFYREKFASVIDEKKLAGEHGPLTSLDQLWNLPYTFKDELLSPQRKEFAANLTYPVERYVRFHQTSGTRGRPLVVLDTAEDWQWWMDCWQYVLDAADIQASDAVMMAFSYGPFIGFWSAHDAAITRGCLVVPSGGLKTLGRLELLRSSRATAMFCTPSYALHMAEVGAQHNIDVGSLGVMRIVVAGEPGGSVHSTRDRIESVWKAKVLDHGGASEIGPWGYGDRAGRGLLVLESEFIAEYISVETGTAGAEGELCELVLTSLGRYGSPVIRYRTGDIVRPTWQHDGPGRFVLLEGGILGRADDMLIVRGVNVFPSAVDQVVRSFPEIIEYRLLLRKAGAMDYLVVEVEDRLNSPVRVAEELQLRLGLTVEVNTVALGSLPRFEAKGKRVVDQRTDTAGA